ncbi:MAG: ParB N-terminal domain-containing protein [Candidatus Thiodiazotropha sp. (ex Ctena orbiculata)]|uniref:ParB N-terminal domain-containing protein n=1 Tax=Candidatus Thiodiazotropha taylori TaxID=2792791 RepID=A0A944MD71_9GAMM|nr:ParB N-terminal domain-containing protein [Candidatus Thiodiazotropha taylori]
MATRKAKRAVCNDAATEGGMVMLDVQLINPYERNPRRSENPEYDRIKDSIRSKGLDQPLVITQRPGSANYIVQAGGNTRLMILKELCEETDDERFSRVQCVVRPWSQESDVLLAHLRENELRGSLTFIDKARAVCDARRLLVEELGIGQVTHRRLEAELRGKGLSVSISSIWLMTYAVEKLADLLPHALQAGMGARHVGRIRALERAAGTLWQRVCSGGEDAFDEVFSALCHRYDGPDWDTDVLQGAIETEIAGESETNLHTIRVALDAEIKGRKLEIPEFVPIKEPPNPERREGSNGVLGPTEDSAREEYDDPDIEEDEAESISVPLPSATPTDDIDDPITDSTKPPIDSGPSKPTDLKSLRGRAWTLAARLAQRNGIGELVMPLSGAGLGYVLRDVPDHSLADQLDENTLAQISMLWWQLAACAEMTFAPLESILPHLPDDSLLRQALADEDAELLFNSIWTLDPGHTGYRLWQSLHDRDWRDLLNLMDTYRSIRHLAIETGTVIWG